MTSFRITISPSRRAAARFVSDVRRQLLRTLTEEKPNGVSQSAIARLLDVHRSVISRELRGGRDITLGRVAELAWAMGRQAQISFPKAQHPDGSNLEPARAPVAGTVTRPSAPGGPASAADAPRTSGAVQRVELV